MKLPMYMKSGKDNKTIIVKWWGVLYLKLRNVFSSNVSTRDSEAERLDKIYDSIHLWTPELIEWIGSTNDPVKLAVTSCIVNSREWPKWLPGKVGYYKKGGCKKELHYRVELYRILKDKSEKISPGLYQKIWLSKYYRTYEC